MSQLSSRTLTQSQKALLFFTALAFMLNAVLLTASFVGVLSYQLVSTDFDFVAMGWLYSKCVLAGLAVAIMLSLATIAILNNKVTFTFRVIALCIWTCVAQFLMTFHLSSAVFGSISFRGAGARIGLAITGIVISLSTCYLPIFMCRLVYSAEQHDDEVARP
ncbi:MAG TPA: hypothetical protein PKD86_09540 [Gemmatales bacterium]|nr:hypothetical protein [Gemmatales bacterium]HMP59583.1 hypothetical protein [Gemmatales bacterium]